MTFREVINSLNETTKKELAEEFEVALSTVSRWANGIAKPHPNVQKLILRELSRGHDFRCSYTDNGCTQCAALEALKDFE